MVKRRIQKIKSHEKVSSFCGELNLWQQLLFSVLLSLWVVGNFYNVISVITSVMDTKNNVKIISSQRKVSDIK